MSWPILPIKSIATVVTGSTPPKSDEQNYGDAYPWVKPPDLGTTTPITSTREFLSEIGAAKARLLPEGAVLVSCIGSIGRIGIAGTCLATNQQINAVVCGDAIVPRFAMYWFMHSTDQLTTAANKAVVPILNKGNFQKLGIPVPSVSEQQCIVKILDQADALRKMRRDADAKVARILPALFLKMFGDPATNPMRWPESTLGKLADDAPEYGANASAAPWEPGLPRYVRITDIDNNGRLSSRGPVSIATTDWDRYVLRTGDVVFARSGNTVGKTYMYRPTDGECVFAGYLIRFQFKSGNASPWFIFGLTRTTYYQNWVASHKRVAGQPNINGREYASLPVPRPSPQLQQVFAGRAAAIEQLLIQADAAAARIDVLFSILLRSVFSSVLTAKWRQAHMQELMTEMQEQARLLNLPMLDGTAA